MLPRRLVDGIARRQDDGHHVGAPAARAVMAIRACAHTRRKTMTIKRLPPLGRKKMAIAQTGLPVPARWPSRRDVGVVLSDGHAPGENTLDRLAVDGLALVARCVAHGAVRDAVNVPEGAGCVLVHQRDGIGRKHALFAPAWARRCAMYSATSSPVASWITKQ